MRVSIHAPAWGATCTCVGFNGINDVSIHAPAWGATIPPRHLCYALFRFNPRTRMGCDKVSVKLPFMEAKFQSTHPHGVRL